MSQFVRRVAISTFLLGVCLDYLVDNVGKYTF